MNPSSAAASQAGLNVCLLQFVFTLGWTVYVIFLPGLLAQAGIDKSWLLWILLADQLIFAAMDVWAGFAADQVQRKFGLLGPWVLGAGLISAAAFFLLPWLGHWLPSAAQAPALLALIFIWVCTSSALRAPPMIMLQKYASRPQTPWLLALYLTGLALAGAVAPYLGVHLKTVNPLLPFALSSLALALTVLGLVHAERRLASQASAQVLKQPGSAPWGLWGAGFLLGAAFQAHFSLNAAPQFLRFAQPADLEWLMPIFWIGFNLILLALPGLALRYGNVKVMIAAAFLAACGSAASVLAGDLSSMALAQLLAGAGWGLLLICGIGQALDLGGNGREGMFLGGFFSVLALATALRIAFVLAKLPANPEWKIVLAWAPACLWLLGGLLLLGLYRKLMRP